MSEECPGIYCDHRRKSQSVPIISQRVRDIVESDSTAIDLNVLIELSECYHCKRRQFFGDIDLCTLAKLRIPMKKLNAVIGMNKIKQEIVEQIIYALSGDLDYDNMHTVIMGKPGIGKTMVVEFLAKVYLAMGMLTRNVIHNVKLTDLKSKWVGGTAIKVQEAIEFALGGVLVIDEAYALADTEADKFSKELIDVLNRNLTDYAGRFICIIIGYKEEIEGRFFSQNPGLHSRFRFRFEIDPYNADELSQIFQHKIRKGGFKTSISETDLNKFFKENYTSFPYYGRDVETLLSHTKVVHRMRTFFGHRKHKGILNISDLMAGYRKFSTHNKPKEELKHLTTMYM